MKTFLSVAFFILLCGIMNGQTSNPPIVSKDYKSWTSNSELTKWLLHLSEIYPVQMRLYRGNREVDMPVVVIPSVQTDALKVMVIAEQYGDEPSGMEACNLLISDLLTGELATWTDSVEWIIVPMVNAEGHENKTRKKKNGADLNRDHLILSQPETQYLHYIYNRYMPDVFVDMHEYAFVKAENENVLEKRIQQQVGCVTNLNLIDVELDRMSHEFILPHIDNMMVKSKISFSEYFIGDAHLNKPIRKCTVDIDDARHGLGAMGRSLSFVVEGLKGQSRNDSIYYRTQAQYRCVLALVEACQMKGLEIKKRVSQNRDNVEVSVMKNVSIQMDHFLPGNEVGMARNLPYWNVKSAKDSLVNVNTLFHSDIRAIQSIEPPVGYWISKKDKKIVDWIQTQESGLFPFSVRQGKVDVKENEELVFQCILATPEWNTKSLEGMNVPAWKPEWIEIKNPSTKDYVFVSTNTLNGFRWIMAFEPESMFALVRYPEFEHLRYQYPILRVISR
ncbi:MAG: hypothetical protein FJX95_02525 [Bacteroidetes bacterium]|nr:hypothetical protein [Bacteroidota bacterium]